MPFTRWVRTVSEEQLLTAAQKIVAKRYGVAPPPRPAGHRHLLAEGLRPALPPAALEVPGEGDEAHAGQPSSEVDPTDPIRGAAV